MPARTPEEIRASIEQNREQLGSPWQQAGEGMPEGVRELLHRGAQDHHP